MARIWIAFIAFLVAAGSACAYFARPLSPDDRSGFDVGAPIWQPNAAELMKLAGTNGTDPDTPTGKAVRLRFAELFQKRYRKHTPEMAVGIRFQKAKLIKLMMPARMEPWNMDRLAVEAWQETRQAFGHPFDIDLYITFIGSTPVKTGVLRQSTTSPDKIDIEHFTMPRHPLTQQGTPHSTRRQRAAAHQTPVM